jgi:hypothetical protein
VVWKARRWTSTSSLANTPDLNNIEPLRSVLVTKVRNRFPPPTLLKQLEDVLLEEWCEIPLKTVQHLYVLYWKQKMVQHHINKEMCTVSVVCPLFCQTPVCASMISVLMLILLLGFCTEWHWTVLQTFRKNMLHKTRFSEMIATWPTSTGWKCPRAGAAPEPQWINQSQGLNNICISRLFDRFKQDAFW